jgi:hypothetical protein
MEPALDLLQFAALSAEIELGVPLAELCAREEISVEEWQHTQEVWFARIAEDAAGKRFELIERYNAALVARRRALQDQKNSPGGTPARPDPMPPAPAPEAALQRPEAVSAEPAPRSSPPPPPLVASPPPQDPSPPGLVPAKKNFGVTTAEPFIAPLAGASVLPFQPAPAATSQLPSGVPAAPASVPAKKDLGVTTAEPFIAPLARASALPFQPASAATPLPARPNTPSGGLPFQRSSPELSAPSPPKPRSNIDLATTAAPSTGPVPPIVPGSSSGLPFRPPPTAAPSSPAELAPRTRLSLEQFASLAAEIAAAPSRIAEVRARYGLDEASHRREVEAYHQLFSAHQDLYRRFGALFQSYREWFAQTHR